MLWPSDGDGRGDACCIGLRWGSAPALYSFSSSGEVVMSLGENKVCLFRYPVVRGVSSVYLLYLCDGVILSTNLSHVILPPLSPVAAVCTVEVGRTTVLLLRYNRRRGWEGREKEAIRRAQHPVQMGVELASYALSSLWRRYGGGRNKSFVTIPPSFLPSFPRRRRHC